MVHRDSFSRETNRKKNKNKKETYLEKRSLDNRWERSTELRIDHQTLLSSNLQFSQKNSISIITHTDTNTEIYISQNKTDQFTNSENFDKKLTFFRMFISSFWDCSLEYEYSWAKYDHFQKKNIVNLNGDVITMELNRKMRYWKIPEGCEIERSIV